ncbi:MULTISPECIES: phage replisome organizer N-terminal domain-containing protein [unclassified Clostridium]|uniref:phage replisome organizer N-terminal domain-containing protein n=1 Tax=unclassified Clostridium TaxID=2614128 RepID=UPI00207A519F|nr:MULTISPECIES: phage replisome organizer N-terminal domain-containing protein [unclassified Clostridium]
MSERKIVKLRVDMYSDTKFKIIDTMEDRDLIHYIWTRLLTLAGKVNLEGELYLSKSIPYTIETLALEFNRSAKMVEIALKVFMDLEMIELTKDSVYRVRNFAKHQNIKSKKKEHHIDKLETVDNIEGVVDKSSDIDSIVNKELMENTHDIGNVIDEDKRIDSEDNINNKELVVKDDRKKNTSNIYNKRDDVIHADKTALHKSNYINTTEVLKSKVPIDNEVTTNDKIDLDKEFVFSKDKNKKKRCKPKTKKKKTNDCDIVSTWEDEANNIEICEFTGEVPKGKVIRTFFIPEV